MLRELKLENVGPASSLEVELGHRLNLVTGDNGLGKSFLLDVAWWALTRSWPADINQNLTSGFRAIPSVSAKPSSISFLLKSKSKDVSYSSKYDSKHEAWIGKSGRPWNPGLVLYAHSDGAFSIWDPARNYWRTRGGVDVQERLPAFVFSPREVWEGKSEVAASRESVISNGLVRDWAGWIASKSMDAKRMAEVLRRLSPSEEKQDLLRPGALTRVGDDVRDVPTVRMPYGADVPIIHASAGIKRITALAYMLVWAWREHVIAAKRLGEKRVNNVVMLVDEIESHLHPKWQRSILGALMGLNDAMYRGAKIQLVVSTHSPLVLASAETLFDEDRDKWLDFDLVENRGKFEAVVTDRPFVRQGSISNWLTSEAFDLKHAGSKQAEAVIEEAATLLSKDSLAKKGWLEMQTKLRAVLSDSDPFWIRWNFVAQKKGFLE